jgi:hypothetical protein
MIVRRPDCRLDAELARLLAARAGQMASYARRVHIASITAANAYTTGWVRGYSVGWLTLSLINAGLAQGKGRSGLGWWPLSLLLGPIATLLIVLLPRLYQAR